MASNNQHSETEISARQQSGFSDCEPCLADFILLIININLESTHGVLCKCSRQEENLKETCSFKYWRCVAIKGGWGQGMHQTDSSLSMRENITGNSDRQCPELGSHLGLCANRAFSFLSLDHTGQLSPTAVNLKVYLGILFSHPTYPFLCIMGLRIAESDWQLANRRK